MFFLFQFNYYKYIGAEQNAPDQSPLVLSIAQLVQVLESIPVVNIALVDGWKNYFTKQPDEVYGVSSLIFTNLHACVLSFYAYVHRSHKEDVYNFNKAICLYKIDQLQMFTDIFGRRDPPDDDQQFIAQFADFSCVHDKIFAIFGVFFHQYINKLILQFLVDFICANYTENVMSTFVASNNFFSNEPIQTNLQFIIYHIMPIIYRLPLEIDFETIVPTLPKLFFGPKLEIEFFNNIQSLLILLKSKAKDEDKQKLIELENMWQKYKFNLYGLKNRSLYDVIKLKIQHMGIKFDDNFEQNLSKYKKIKYVTRLQFNPRNFTVLHEVIHKSLIKVNLHENGWMDLMIKEFMFMKGNDQNWCVNRDLLQLNSQITHEMIKKIFTFLEITSMPRDFIGYPVCYPMENNQIVEIYDFYVMEDELCNLISQYMPKQIMHLWTDDSGDNLQDSMQNSMKHKIFEFKDKQEFARHHIRLCILKTVLLLLNIYDELRQIPNRDEAFDEILQLIQHGSVEIM